MITTLLYSLFALDQSLSALAAQHAWLMFAALFIVIFAETGLVIFPLLPGDSLLFVAGTVAAASGVNVHLLVLTLLDRGRSWEIRSITRSVISSAPRSSSQPHESRLGRWLKPEYMDRTHRFYEKYGGFTIIIGRFVPVVRTFAPFLAGVGQMRYRKFLAYNVIGGAAWVGSAHVCRLSVRQYPVGQEQPGVDRSRHRRGFADAHRAPVDKGKTGAKAEAGEPHCSAMLT